MRGQAYLVAAGLFLAALPADSIGAQGGPPVAKRITKVDTLHGDILRDDYFWLREKTNPEVVRYLEAENAYTASGLAHTKPTQDSIYREMLGRIKETDLSVPCTTGATGTTPAPSRARSYPIFCRKQGTLRREGRGDPRSESAGAGQELITRWAGSDVSPDGNLLLYLEDTTAFREYTLRVKDLSTGAAPPGLDPGVWNGTAWADDNRTFFYTRADSAKRANAVWRHVIGTPAERDVKVFQEDNVLYDVGLQLGRRAASTSSSPLTASPPASGAPSRPTGPPAATGARPRGEPTVEYSVDHIPGAFLILTNDGATNFRVVRARRRATPGPRRGATGCRRATRCSSKAFDVFRTHVVVSERANGLRRLRVVRLADRAHALHHLPRRGLRRLPSRTIRDFEASTLRFSYSSMTTPARSTSTTWRSAPGPC